MLRNYRTLLCLAEFVETWQSSTKLCPDGDTCRYIHTYVRTYVHTYIHIWFCMYIQYTHAKVGLQETSKRTHHPSGHWLQTAVGGTAQRPGVMQVENQKFWTQTTVRVIHVGSCWSILVWYWLIIDNGQNGCFFFRWIITWKHGVIQWLP